MGAWLIFWMGAGAEDQQGSVKGHSLLIAMYYSSMIMISKYGKSVR